MNIVMFSADDCPLCVRVFAYLLYLARGVPFAVHDASAIENVKDAALRRDVRADLAFQHDRLPLVYIDGIHQDLDDLLKKVKAHELAQRNDIEQCSKEFLFA